MRGWDNMIRYVLHHLREKRDYVLLGVSAAAGEVAFIMALGGLLEEVTSQRAYSSVASLVAGGEAGT